MTHPHPKTLAEAAKKSASKYGGQLISEVARREFASGARWMARQSRRATGRRVAVWGVWLGAYKHLHSIHKYRECAKREAAEWGATVIRLPSTTLPAKAGGKGKAK